MIFSKPGCYNLPLWYLVFLKEKVVTRRPPPCLHCGKKWWAHESLMTTTTGDMMCCVINGEASTSGKHYEPNLSRWQPPCCLHSEEKHEGRKTSCALCGSTACAGKMPPCKGYIPREIAIQPARTEASVCKICGGFKEWHTEKDKNYKTRTYDFDTKTWLYGKPWHGKGVTIEVCPHYEPLRLKVKSVMMESEWLVQRSVDKFAEGQLNGKKASDLMIKELSEEATREGFSSWADLQEALSMYPKGTPLARIEFEKVV